MSVFLYKEDIERIHGTVARILDPWSVERIPRKILSGFAFFQLTSGKTGQTFLIVFTSQSHWHKTFTMLEKIFDYVYAVL